MELPTGRRVRLRADLSARVMLRSGLVRAADEELLADALENVEIDDAVARRRLQDALVMHALGETETPALDALAEDEFLAILTYAIARLTPAPEPVEEAEEAVAEPDDDPEPVEETIDEALARMDAMPATESVIPESAKVLDEPEVVTHGE